MKVKIAVFASGSGSDFQSIIEGVESGVIKNAEVSLLVASQNGIGSIDRAEKYGIKHVVFNKSNFTSLQFMYDVLAMELQRRKIDIIVLAGYLNILTPNIINKYRNRIVNIHPSLIPKHCGLGYYGMKVHEAVIAAGDTFSGATVHYVDEGADTGKIIMQEKVVVLPNDTAHTLRERVLELEHRLLPVAVAKVCEKYIAKANK